MGLEDVLNDVIGDEQQPEEETEETNASEQSVDEDSEEAAAAGEEGDEEEGADEGEGDEEGSEEDESDEAEPKRTIPLAAHREERSKLTARAREAEQRARQYELQLAQMQAYLQAQQQGHGQPQPQAPAAPQAAPAVDVGHEPEFKPSVSYDDNPATYLREQNQHMQELIRYQNKVNAAQLEALKNETTSERQAREKAEKEWQEQQQRQYQQHQQTQQIDARILQSEKQAAQDLPQYHEAVSYLYGILHTQVMAEIEMLGVPEPQRADAAKEMLRQRTRATAAQVLQRGGEPAEWVYNYALKMGYRVADDKLDRVAEGRARTEGVTQMRGAAGAKPTKDDGDFLAAAQREAGLI